MTGDLDRLMRERSIGALLVPLHELMHPSFRWISRGAKITRGYVVHARGESVLIHYPMERDEAVASGLATRSIHDFDYQAIFRSAPDPASAYAQFFDRLFRQLEVEGDVAIGGQLPAHLYLEMPALLSKLGWQVHRALGEDLLQLARKRKEAWEIEAIRSVGERTEAVVAKVRALLRRVEIIDGIAHERGELVTIGSLKRLVTSEILALGMVEDHETILSQGRDAAVPHSRGDASAPLRASLPLVIDIFPSDRQSGYFFDLTRTFCIGPVPDRLRHVHGDVVAAFDLARANARAGVRASDLQELVCELFERHGYATLRQDPAATSGYVHGLGHGVGLEVHEKPSFALADSNHDRIEVGDVLTIEPGLYFPDEGIGVRIEETFYVDESGAVVTFCSSDRSLDP